MERCSTNSTYGEREKNASTGYIGGIEATNAEIMEHNGGKDAIKDMVTAAQEKGKASATHADNLRDRYGENLSVGYKGLSLADTMSAIDGSKLDSQAGQALGVLANKDKGVDVDYADNAMYGEMSKQQSTKAKLDAQGGVAGAVHVDTVDAQVKAKTQQDVLDAQLKQSGKADEGLKSSADDLSKAADKLAQTAGTLAGGKTASDMATVGKFDSPEQLAKSEAQKASAQATVDKTRLEKSEDGDITQKKLEAMRKDANDKDLFDSQAIASKIATRNADGSLKATTDSTFTDGLSALGAGDMPSTSQLIIGKERINVDTDLDGNALINRDSSENHKKGWTESIGVSGVPEALFGSVGTGMLGVGMGVAAAEAGYIKFGPKGNDGIIKPGFKKAANSLASAVGREEPFPETPQETVDSTGKNDNGKPNNSSDSKVKESVHNDPLNKNTEGKTPPSESSITKTSESVKPSIAQEIDYHTKSQKREAAFESAQKTRDNLLKVPQSPEAVAKINADFEAKSKAIKSAYPQCR